ncbi:MAG: hypothetical protein KDA77_23625, partial [Planctomycetaceae bacterium]|nr:hypothetical protein [Planctomycetaceae bacterium]
MIYSNEAVLTDWAGCVWKILQTARERFSIGIVISTIRAAKWIFIKVFERDGRDGNGRQGMPGSSKSSRCAGGTNTSRQRSAFCDISTHQIAPWCTVALRRLTVLGDPAAPDTGLLDPSGTADLFFLSTITRPFFSTHSRLSPIASSSAAGRFNAITSYCSAS